MSNFSAIVKMYDSNLFIFIPLFMSLMNWYSVINFFLLGVFKFSVLLQRIYEIFGKVTNQSQFSID